MILIVINSMNGIASSYETRLRFYTEMIPFLSVISLQKCVVEFEPPSIRTPLLCVEFEACSLSDLSDQISRLLYGYLDLAST